MLRKIGRQQSLPAQPHCLPAYRRALAVQPLGNLLRRVGRPEGNKFAEFVVGPAHGGSRRSWPPQRPVPCLPFAALFWRARRFPRTLHLARVAVDFGSLAISGGLINRDARALPAFRTRPRWRRRLRCHVLRDRKSFRKFSPSAPRAQRPAPPDGQSRSLGRSPGRWPGGRCPGRRWRRGFPQGAGGNFRGVSWILVA
jgi:hypothetical protein